MANFIKYFYDSNRIFYNFTLYSAKSTVISTITALLQFLFSVLKFLRIYQPVLLPRWKLSHAVFLGFSRLLCIARCLCSGAVRFSKGFHSCDQSRARLLSAFLVRLFGAVCFFVCFLECHQCCFRPLTEGSVKIAFSFFGV